MVNALKETINFLTTPAIFITLAAVTRVDRAVRQTALALGASELQVLWRVLREARFGISGLLPMVSAV